MKIGEVSNLTGFSKDTLRYYMKDGVILPGKKGSLLHFEEKDLKDIEFVKKLKSMNFSLQEIHTLVSARRLSNEHDSQFLNLYSAMLREQSYSIIENIQNMYSKLNRVDTEFRNVSNLQSSNSDLSGVPLIAFSILSCPICNKKLEAENAKISHKGITCGDVVCSCGYKIQIEDGILLTGNLPTTKYDSPDLSRGLYMNMLPEVSLLQQKTYKSISENLSIVGTKDKIILETNINSGFFLYSWYKEFGDGLLYIVTDKYKETLKMYKNVVEQLNPDMNILYIADDSTNFPLKKDSIDIFIDSYACNTHSMYHHSFLPGEIAVYIKPNGCATGAFVYFDENAKTHINIRRNYPESDPDFPYLDKFIKRLSLSYKNLTTSDIGYVNRTPSGRYLFGCHVDGEKWSAVAYTAFK